ncbi:MAG: hypothetical protein LBF54_02135 [Holosporaceae bacterium]|nr:hypothetical protein [Holosporaceae bacterium]
MKKTIVEVLFAALGVAVAFSPVDGMNFRLEKYPQSSRTISKRWAMNFLERRHTIPKLHDRRFLSHSTDRMDFLLEKYPQPSRTIKEMMNFPDWPSEILRLSRDELLSHSAEQLMWVYCSREQMMTLLSARTRVPEDAIAYLFSSSEPYKTSDFPSENLTLKDLKSLVARGANPRRVLSFKMASKPSALIRRGLEMTRDYMAEMSPDDIILKYGYYLGGTYDFLSEDGLKVINNFAKWLEENYE